MPKIRIFIKEMNNIRRLHTLIGCFFAPLLVYFCISGAWQIFDLHHHPKGVEPTRLQSFLHHLSNPHTDSTLPWRHPDDGQSFVYKFFVLIMALGFVMTALMGVQMAFQLKRIRKPVLICLALGFILPAVLLFL